MKNRSRKITGPTHNITFSKSGEAIRQQKAWGKADLFEIIRAMLKDGYTNITIRTIEYT
jgi:hypothetical protein